MVLQLIEACHQEWSESAEVRQYDLDIRKAAREIRLHELQQAHRVFERRANRPYQVGGFDQLRSEAAAGRVNEENGFAAIELREKSVEGGIGDALSEDYRAGRHAHHAEFIERAARFLDRRLHVRERSAGKGPETFRIFADDARVDV